MQTIGKYTLEQLRKQYHYDLFDDFLPFMDKYVIDHELGGFMCTADRDGARLSTNKESWYEGRGIWVYSFLYNYLAKEPKYVDVARRSADFILKAKPSDGRTLCPRSFTREGKPLTEPSGEIYGDLFIAEGLAELAHASGEQRYRDLAKQILKQSIEVFDRADYFPKIGETYLGKGMPPLPGARIQGVWMVLIRIATQMLEHAPDPEIEKLAERCVDAIINRHYNPDFQLNNELLNHDFSRPGAPFDQLVYTGHAIETLWMVLYEATRQKNKKLFDTTADRFRRHIEVAWDDVYGGVFRNLQNVDQNVWSVDKVLWAQEEVLIGTLFIVEHTGAEWAKEWFARMYEYVQRKFVLKQYGFPLWITAADRKVTFERHASRVENFHHPRHLMFCLLTLDRMIARKGAVSGLFA